MYFPSSDLILAPANKTLVEGCGLCCSMAWWRAEHQLKPQPEGFGSEIRGIFLGKRTNKHRDSFSDDKLAQVFLPGQAICFPQEGTDNTGLGLAPWRMWRLGEILKESSKNYWDGRCWGQEQVPYLSLPRDPWLPGGPHSGGGCRTRDALSFQRGPDPPGDPGWSERSYSGRQLPKGHFDNGLLAVTNRHWH